jgi:hypothetical protein
VTVVATKTLREKGGGGSGSGFGGFGEDGSGSRSMRSGGSGGEDGDSDCQEREGGGGAAQLHGAAVVAAENGIAVGFGEEACLYSRAVFWATAQQFFATAQQFWPNLYPKLSPQAAKNMFLYLYLFFNRLLPISLYS